MTDGLFLEAVRHVARDFPQVQLDDLLVDASTAHLVREPERFDVLVATNFYGDILSDLASELSGSLGLAGSMTLPTLSRRSFNAGIAASMGRQSSAAGA